MRSKIIIIFLFPLWLWGCSAHKKAKIPEQFSKLKNLAVIPVDAKPAYHIHFKQDATYGTTNDVIVGSIGDIAVDSNYVLIEDAQQRVIDVFAPDGHYVGHFGGEGKGPGEFINLDFMGIVSNQLYAFDLYLKRMNIFSLDSLALSRTLNLKPSNKHTIKSLIGYGMHHIFFRNDGNFLVMFVPLHYPREPGYDRTKVKQQYFLMNDRGKIISDEILEQRGLGFGFLLANVGGEPKGGAFRFLPHSLIATSADGRIYAGWSADFLIKEYNPNGHYTRAFYCPFQKVRLTQDAALKQQENWANTKDRQSVIRHKDIPAFRPAMHAIKVDDQHRLWISTIVKDQKVYQWWVLNKKGKLIVRFNWPRSKPIQEIKGGHLYTKETNKQSIPQIVRYKIAMQ